MSAPNPRFNRSANSSMWRAFRSGMTAAELAHAGGGNISRRSATLFLRGAEGRGELAGQDDPRGERRYYATHPDTPLPGALPQLDFRPLRRPFAGRPVIPVRPGGRVAAVNLQGRFEAVGRGVGVVEDEAVAQ